MTKTHIKFVADREDNTVLFMGIYQQTEIYISIRNVPEADLFSLAKFTDGGTGKILKTNKTSSSRVFDLDDELVADKDLLTAYFEGCLARMIDDGLEMEDNDGNYSLKF